MPSTNQSKFHGFRRPTTTPVPDEIFDDLMHELSGAELKVLLYICRRTFGFKKDSDSISLSQMVRGITTKGGKVLDGGTGLGKTSVARAITALEKKGAIVRNRNRSRAKGDEATTYTLNILPVSQNGTGGTPKMEQGGVPKVDTQQTVLQETEDNNDVVVIAQLKIFGISTPTANRFAKNSPRNTWLTNWLLLSG